MYSRSTTMSFTYPSQHAYRPAARSTEPEVFTFDPVPEQHFSLPRHHHLHHQQQRRRVTRVLYPAKVRKYLPPAEKNPAKRWLLALCLVLLAQIYTERDDEQLADTDTAAAAVSHALAGNVPGDGASASSPLFLHFRSAEETARPRSSCSTHSEPRRNTTCGMEETQVREQRQQQRNNPYVVALLYPAVYHTLGCEQ